VKLAVCIVVHRDGKLCIVARKKRPDDWNLPGGKVEDFETLEEAAERELKEETGLTTPMGDVSYHRVYVDVIDDYVAVCYVAHTVVGPIIQNPNEGAVRWGTWDDILNDKSVFHDYNRKLFNALKEQGFVR
jgi:8-oxo-dGTP diphosphatase